MKPSRPADSHFDWRDDTGQVGGIEIVPFGILIFVVGVLLIANAWAVVDARLAVQAAAREAARSFVEAPDEAHGVERADAVAHEAIAGHGRDPALVRVDGPAYGGTGVFERCTPVTWQATYPVPAISLPWIGGYGHTFDVTSTHTEVIDPYRSGLNGAAAC